MSPSKSTPSKESLQGDSPSVLLFQEWAGQMGVRRDLFGLLEEVTEGEEWKVSQRMDFQGAVQQVAPALRGCEGHAGETGPDL